jgi:acetyl esterase
MPLDPELRAMLDAAAAGGPVPMSELPVEVARAGYQAGAAASLGDGYQPIALAEVSDRVVAGSVPVRVYRPDAPGPRPAVAFAHGGGWVVGDLDTHDETCRYLSQSLSAVVVAVDYRRAPEHPYPAAIDDYWAAVCWLAENAGGLGADPGALAVIGDSAGGHLAAAAALRARAAGGPAIAVQALAYPVTDATMGTASDPLGSYATRADGYGLSSTSMAWFLDCYLPDPATRTRPDNSPLLVEDLAGLPPAVVATAEFDPLRDEGARYARRLGQAGVPVTWLPGDGLVHGYLRRTRESRAAARARRAFADAISATLAVRPAPAGPAPASPAPAGPAPAGPAPAGPAPARTETAP